MLGALLKFSWLYFVRQANSVRRSHVAAQRITTPLRPIRSRRSGAPKYAGKQAGLDYVHIHHRKNVHQRFGITLILSMYTGIS